MLNAMGQAKADELDAVGHPDAAKGAYGDAAIRRDNASVIDGKALDRTHLNDNGKAVFGRIVADELARTLVELRRDIQSGPAAAR